MALKPRRRNLALLALAFPAAGLFLLMAVSFVWSIFWTQANTPARAARGELPDARFVIARGSFHYCDDNAMSRPSGAYILGYPTDGQYNVLSGWLIRQPAFSLKPDLQVNIEPGNIKFPLVFLAGTLCIPPAIFWAVTRKGKSGHCAACNYNRAGLQQGAQCPECGTIPSRD